ncbi:acyl-CoA dehydrogenase family protein [Streptomyces mirabilis]|uniref:acyl-CoA dehydrogenase family protein n=1 Tax=Streptomyces sp. NPDC005388 TaxID=3156717 RepID=UPI0033AB9ED0
MSTELRIASTAACGEELVERARIAARTLETSTARREHGLRPATDSLAAVRRAGLFAMTVPRASGGAGATLRTQVRVITELGQRCPSTAWTTALSAALKTVCTSVFPEAAREVLFADRDAVVCGSATPLRAHGEPTGYGFSISGRWQALTGCEDSAWTVLAVPVLTEGQPISHCAALVSTRDLTVEHPRHTTRMAGTDSHTLVAQDVVVPPAHVLSSASAAVRAPDSPAGATAQLGIAVVMLAPLLGAARGIRRAMEAAAACRLLDSATGRVLRVADALDARMLRAPASSVFLPAQERACLRAELVSATQECRETAERLLDPHDLGRFAPATSLPLIRHDLAALAHLPQFSPHTIAADFVGLLFGPGTAWTSSRTR